MSKLHTILTILLEVMLLSNIIIALISNEVTVLSFILVNIIAMMGALPPPSNRSGGRYA